MRSAQAFQIEPSPAEQVGQDRRTPDFLEDLGPAPLLETAALHWPASWPAALYFGDGGDECRVRVFSAKGAEIIMDSPPPVGTSVLLKFPFTVYLKGRVAWSGADDLGIEFDEDTRRSARIVEEVLLDNTGI